MKSDKKRTELNLHTNMSRIDSLIGPKDIIELAETHGLDSVAITDFHSVQAFPEIYRLVQEQDKDLKIIYGAEVRCRMAGEANTVDFTLLVRNQRGLKNLYKIISAITADETLDNTYMLAHREGLLLGWSCKNQMDFAGTDCDYIEIHPANECKNKALIEHLRDTDNHTPVVAVSNARYVEKEDALWREGLRAQMELENDDPLHSLYLHTSDEMLSALTYLGEETAHTLVLENPNQIASMIEPVVPIPDGRFLFSLPNAAEELRAICQANAEKKYGPKLPTEVTERLNTELPLILKQHWESYYVLAQKLTAYARSLGYHTGTRGRVASSFVAHLLGVTDINPLPPHYVCPQCKHSEFITDDSVVSGFDLPDMFCPVCGEPLRGDGHHIPFESFMGIHGEQIPDIDLEIPVEIRETLSEFLVSIFDEEHLTRIGTISTFLGERPDMQEALIEYVQRAGENVLTATAKKTLFEKARDVKTGVGIWPGRYMFIPAEMDIFDFTPIRRIEDNSIKNITHFQSSDLRDTLGLIDLLSHTTHCMLKRLEEFTNTKVSEAKINDPAIYALIRGEHVLNDVHVGPLGLGEFEDEFMRELVQELHPKCFSDLMKLRGFAHGIDVWTNNGCKLIASGTARFEKLIAFQDDIFLMLQKHGVEQEKAYRIMEIVHKGKAKHLLTEQDVQELHTCDIPLWYIESCKGIKYLGNKAHAAEYMLASVRLAWYKIYYPTAFYAAYFSTLKDQTESSVYEECLSLGIALLPSDPKKSDKRLFLPENGNIRRPLS